MEQLKVIGTEDDVLVLATESGERFSLADRRRAARRAAPARKRTRRRRARRSPEPARDPGAHPRRHVRRRGRRAARASASRTSPASRVPCSPSASTSSARRWRCPCSSAASSSPTSHPTFGAAVRAKLAEAGAIGERWTSWKEHDRLDRQARVHRERGRSRRPLEVRPAPQHALAAERRCRSSCRGRARCPRGSSRACARWTPHPRQGRHAVRQRRLRSARRPMPEADLESPDLPEPVAPAVQEAAIKRATAPAVDHRPRPPTCSRRCAAGAGSASRCPGRRARRPPRTHAPGRPVRRARARLRRDAARTRRALRQRHRARRPVAEAAGRRKGRTSMPSWDEIVFGARTEDD